MWTIMDGDHFQLQGFGCNPNAVSDKRIERYGDYLHFSMHVPRRCGELCVGVKTSQTNVDVDRGGDRHGGGGDSHARWAHALPFALCAWVCPYEGVRFEVFQRGCRVLKQAEPSLRGWPCVCDVALGINARGLFDVTIGGEPFWESADPVSETCLPLFVQVRVFFQHASTTSAS
jgi:hypothetical protein